MILQIKLSEGKNGEYVNTKFSLSLLLSCQIAPFLTSAMPTFVTEMLLRDFLVSTSPGMVL